MNKDSKSHKTYMKLFKQFTNNKNNFILMSRYLPDCKVLSFDLLIIFKLILLEV